jgi:hypothetical protein
MPISLSMLFWGAVLVACAVAAVAVPLAKALFCNAADESFKSAFWLWTTFTTASALLYFAGAPGSSFAFGVIGAFVFPIPLFAIIAAGLIESAFNFAWDLVHKK